jgi:hypothetical protein
MPHGNSYERSSAIDVARQLVARPATTDRLLPNRCAVADTLANYAALIGAGYAGKTGSDSTAGGCLAFFTDATVGRRRAGPRNLRLHSRSPTCFPEGDPGLARAANPHATDFYFDSPHRLPWDAWFATVEWARCRGQVTWRSQIWVVRGLYGCERLDGM